MKAENNKMVAVDYTLTVDGKIADRSRPGQPLEFIFGTGMLLPKFEAAIVGKEPGEKVSFTLAPADGYGEIVDDAIVVVEAVQVNIEKGMNGKDATITAMKTVASPIIATTTVLMAVFLPVGLMPGATGKLYGQFAITIAISVALSGINALSLSPALCSILLRPQSGKKAKGFFGWFNRTFNKGAEGATSAVGYMTARWKRFIVIYGVIIAGVVFGFLKVPTAFMPDEDQGSLMVQIQLPEGSTREQILPVVKRMQDYMLNDEKDSVESVMTVVGFSLAGMGQNSAMAFIKLKDWSERPKPEQKAQAVAARANRTLMSWKDSIVFGFALPPVPELGMADGFDMYLQDLSGQGHDALMAARNQVLGAARSNPQLYNVRPNGKEDAPQLQLHIDFAKAASLGVSVASINDTLSTAWGSSYVNDFYDRGRIKQVYVQGDEKFRQRPEDLDRWYVRNDKGEMVPFSAFCSTEWKFGSSRLERFNGLGAVNIQGAPAAGFTTGQAMLAMEEIAKALPHGFGIAWNGISFQEQQAGSQTGALYTLSILIVFLCLAALYESWSIPIAVILVVPLGVIGALGMTGAFGMNNDVYFQVGLLTTIGLVSKNAILIVEFAKELHEKGESIVHAAAHAVRMRIRPIMMTSLAFGLGVLPLAKATGAGSGAQNAIGIGVLGGMLTGTFLCIFFVPLFYVLIVKLFGDKIKKKKPQEALQENK